MRADTSMARGRGIGVYIRQLCVSGVESHLLMYRLLPAVREMSAADWGCFCWYDGGYRMTAYVAQSHPQLSMAPTCRELSEAAGIHHSLQVTASYGARAWGTLQLYRGRQAPGFDLETERALGQLGPYLAQALRAPRLADDRFVATEDSGVLLTDPGGQITSINARTAGLLTLASSTITSLKRLTARKVPDFLTPLVRQVRRTRTGGDSGVTRLVTESSWGKFEFHAYPLGDLEHGGSGSIAIHVRRLEPFLLNVHHGAFLSGLNGRQQEVCLHIAARRSYAETAALMSIRPSTVVDHVRCLYSRLDVHSHDELLCKLGEAALA